MVAARALRYLPWTGEGHVFTERRAALDLSSRMRTKMEQNKTFEWEMGASLGTQGALV